MYQSFIEFWNLEEKKSHRILTNLAEFQLVRFVVLPNSRYARWTERQVGQPQLFHNPNNLLNINGNFVKIKLKLVEMNELQHFQVSCGTKLKNQFFCQEPGMRDETTHFWLQLICLSNRPKFIFIRIICVNINGKFVKIKLHLVDNERARANSFFLLRNISKKKCLSSIFTLQKSGYSCANYRSSVFCILNTYVLVV